MSTRFITKDLWPTLTAAIKKSSRACHVAVAYLGQGASKLLPLPSGSRLIVDASERTVKLGLTCPAELIKLQKRGVKVFSLANLHAKVYVVGKSAFIGSANVSSHSAGTLVETLLYTTEPGAVRDARQFVRDHSLQELGPRMLKELAKIYRPPRVPGGKRGKTRVKETVAGPTLPRLLLVQLALTTWSERDQNLHDRGMAVAKKRRQHPRSFELDSFGWSGHCSCQRGDVVVQITDEGNGRVLVAPPGNVLHVRTRRDGNRQLSFVYVELPIRRRRQVKSLARVLGCTQKRLRRDGVIRDASLAERLLNTWTVTL
jgi:hypothetical protein